MSNNPQSSMSEVAQKLCDEIVKRNSKPPTTEEKPWKKRTNFPGSSRSKNALKSVITEKKKVISKQLPQTSDCKSKNSILKNKTVIDVAVNTLVTGPLRCDNNCVTVVHRRDNKVCKCAQRYSHVSSIAKQLQTFDSRNYLYTDKASAQCVETTSCGTQFFESNENKKYESTHNQTQERTNRTTVNYDPKHSKCDSLWGLSSNLSQQLVKQYPKYMCSKRWALTQYPTRGPDF